MAQFGGMQGLGGPINYYDQMVPDFRGEAVKTSQAHAMDVQSQARQQEMAQQQQSDVRKKKFYDAISNATPDQLPALRRQFPEYAQNIQQEIGIQDEDHAKFVNKSLNNISTALASNNPQILRDAIQKSAPALASMNMTPDQALQLYQQDPLHFSSVLKTAQMGTLPFDKQVDAQQNQQKIEETIRSNRAGEALQGQQIAVSRENSIRSANGQGSMPANVREYEYVKNLSPEDKKEYLRLTNKKVGGQLQPAQLSSGETVMIDPAPLGAGSTKFYKGYDASGNVITVPVSSLATSADSATTAGQNLINSDLNNLQTATPDQLNVLTGVTGGIGNPALGADIRTRIGDKDTRKLYSSAQRIQGYMQNQGIGAAKAMGASGINTEAEAKRFFQSMPQLDYSSPDALISSAKTIDNYARSYNAKSNVNYGSQGQQQQPAPQQQTGYSSLWGD
ncbi:DNA transfer protein [Buttiauxella sp.]|uniref:DNA transfer protein n=1 Tax=Buttiauxella sp. TaxID=1972222 RepID=UPI003C780A91